MRIIRPLCLVALMLPAPGAAAQSPPPETEQFARLAGEWEVEVWSREGTGAWPDRPSVAHWSWQVILGGHAVQDFWLAPPGDPAASTAWARGTNLRIYDPASGRWQVRWTASDDRRFMELSGGMEDDTLRLYTTHESGAPLRVSFFDVRPERFSWRLDARSAAGDWTPWSRMEATRTAPGARTGAAPARDIELEILVDRPPEEVLEDWLDEDTVDRFFGVSSTIEARVGGPYEIRFLPGDDADARANATVGARVLALDPGRHLAFEWRLPPWAGEPARSAPPTRVDLHLAPATDPVTGRVLEGRTALSLHHTGFGPGPAWGAVRSFFLRSWFAILARYRAMVDAGAG